MVSHMKTTIHIADTIYSEAREIAARDSTTIRALVEEGLRLILARRRATNEPFRMRRASFGGNGLQPEFRATGWERFREAAYEGRGG